MKRFIPATIKGPRTPRLGALPLGALLVALAAVGCTDEGANLPTSPVFASEDAAGVGTPVDPNVPSPAAGINSAPAAAAANGGPRVGVLAYCTDLVGSVGAENVANTLLADGRFGSATVVDGDVDQPTAQQLLDAYDAVIAMTDNRCGIPIPQAIADAAADALTGYVQGGGGAVLATFGFSDRPSGGIGFGASIFGAGLSPLQQATPFGNATAGAIDVAGASMTPPCDALLDGVTSPVSSSFANNVSLSAGATLCASYTNEPELLAINADGNVVGLNTFPASLSDNTQASYQRLVSNAVFAVAAEGTTETVPAGEAATVTVAENGKAVAGIDIPAGSFNETVIVTVRFEELEAGERCHDFLLGQVGRCLEIKARPDGGVGPVTPTKPLVIAVCLPGTPPELDLFEFHERNGRAVALKNVVDFLDCTGFLGASESSWLKQFASGLVNGVQGLFGATPLMAVADRGFGGEHPPGEGLETFFTWASPIQVSNAGLGVNVRNSGKDAFGVSGTFDLSPKDFEPNLNEAGFNPAGVAADNLVTVAFGAYTQSIAANKFVFSSRRQRFVYSALTTTGIRYMEIDAATGSFAVAGDVPTEGGTLPADRPFSVQIGHRTQGALLECGTDHRCTTH